MVSWAGFEPATYPLGGDRAIHCATRTNCGEHYTRSCSSSTTTWASFFLIDLMPSEIM